MDLKRRLLPQREMFGNIIRLFLNLFFRNNNLFVSLIKAHLHNNRIIIDKSSNLYNCEITIMGRGNSVFIGSKCTLRRLSLYMNDDNNTIRIGDGVIVNGRKYGETRFNACNGATIHIGDNCLFSNNIELHTTDYHPIFGSDNERKNYAKSIVIGKDSWIGFRTVVLKGVNLSPNTIVGACSVITKSNANEYEVLAGNPTSVVKKGYTWRRS